MKLHFRHKSAQ